MGEDVKVSLTLDDVSCDCGASIKEITGVRRQNGCRTDFTGNREVEK